MTNSEFVKGSNYTLEEMFDMFKDQFLSIQEWSDILKAREGILNFSSLYRVINKCISYYDSSNKVNSFIYKNNNYWLDKDTRIGLFRLIDSGAEQITLKLNSGTYIDITPSRLKEFLNQLEVYAGKCFSITAKHLQNLYNLHTIEELLQFDYTADYPDKITLNED